jgi:hypothetical protein
MSILQNEIVVSVVSICINLSYLYFRFIVYCHLLLFNVLHIAIIILLLMFNKYTFCFRSKDIIGLK